MSTENNKEQNVAAEATAVTAEAVATQAVVDAPATDTTTEPREARRGSRDRGPSRDRGSRDSEKSQFLERVVTINRVSKVV